MTTGDGSEHTTRDADWYAQQVAIYRANLRKALSKWAYGFDPWADSMVRTVAAELDAVDARPDS